MEETETQEQREQETRRVHTPTTTRPRSASPPHVHPQSATAQLGLTQEEANEVHEECIRAQEELQEEMQREDHKREAKQNGYPPLPEHPTYNMTSDYDTHVVSLGHQVNDGGTASSMPEHDAIGQLEYELDTLRVGHGNWA